MNTYDNLVRGHPNKEFIKCTYNDKILSPSTISFLHVRIICSGHCNSYGHIAVLAKTSCLIILKLMNKLECLYNNKSLTLSLNRDVLDPRLRRQLFWPVRASNESTRADVWPQSGTATRQNSCASRRVCSHSRRGE